MRQPAPITEDGHGPDAGEMTSYVCLVHCTSIYAMGFHKSTLVRRGANTQLDPSCVSVPPATNVDLFACFAASDSLYVGMPYV